MTTSLATAVAVLCLTSNLLAQTPRAAPDDQPRDESLQALGVSPARWRRVLELDKQLSGPQREFSLPLLQKVADASSEAEQTAAREDMQAAVGLRRLRLKHELHQLLIGQAPPGIDQSDESVRSATLQRDGLAAFEDYDLCDAYRLPWKQTRRINQTCAAVAFLIADGIEGTSLAASDWARPTFAGYALSSFSREQAALYFADLKRGQTEKVPPPKEARIDTAPRLLRGDSVPGFLSAYELLMRPAVQKELCLSSQQVARIDTLQELLETDPAEARPWLDIIRCLEGRDAKNIARRQLKVVTAAIRRRQWLELESVLTETQFKLLKCILVSESRVGALLDWGVCRDLGLSPLLACQIRLVYHWHRDLHNRVHRRDVSFQRDAIGSLLVGTRLPAQLFPVRVDRATAKSPSVEDLILTQLPGEQLVAFREYLQECKTLRGTLADQLRSRIKEAGAAENDASR